MTSAVPTWEQYMLPALKVLADGQVHRARDVCDAAADILRVGAEERTVLIPSGQPRYLDRSRWALSDLSRAGAIERVSRGHYRISDSGRELLRTQTAGLTKAELRQLLNLPPEGSSPSRRATAGLAEPATEASELSPTEQVEQGIARIHDTVVQELLARLHAQEPAFFEQAVLDLLMAMGYGGAEGHATRTQLSNDGGIDGVIDQDALGLSRIYVQAKRYAPESSVGRPDIQGFVGALHGHQAGQGVFITTGRFSSGAVQYAESVAIRVALIDGARLARLMIRYRVGVQVRKAYDVVELDEDYFE
ncbi:MAG: restriction endonuclease [Arachnia sp.]